MNLGDLRRTNCLVKLAATIANEPRKPLVNITLVTDIESLRLQSKDNVERLVTINGFIATRILQLKFVTEQEHASCEQMLSPTAWRLLWLKRMKKNLPEKVPNMSRTYQELAKLGGWKDTKCTGRASFKVIWQGWFQLQTILEGYKLAKSLESDL